MLISPTHPVFRDLCTSDVQIRGTGTTMYIETCPHCGGTLRVIACIEEPALIARILGHVQQREELNGPLTRAPPGQQEVTFNLN